MILNPLELIVLVFDLIRLIIGIYFAFLSAVFEFLFPPKPKSLWREIVLIVGTEYGIGRELALQYAALGAVVVCWDTNRRENERLAFEIRKRGRRAYAFTCDITKREQVLTTGKRVLETIGPVSVIVHSCGLPNHETLLDVTENADSFFCVEPMEKAVLSLFWLQEAFLETMIKQGKGHWVLLSSVAGIETHPQHLGITAAQFAVQGFSESISYNLPKKNVNVSLVHIYPFILPPLFQKILQKRISSYFGTIEPQDAARHIIYGMRRNRVEFSIPLYLHFLNKLLRILPKKSAFMLRDSFDTGVDFG
nr:PREDICTED: estradiol 17-beta-dehydrogenase 11-like [Bemisia tabaci]